MPTLIKVPGLKRSRVCTSQCQNAKHDYCICICGGVNHQAGPEKAVENTRVLMSVFQEQYPSVKFSKEVLQLKLEGVQM